MKELTIICVDDEDISLRRIHSLCLEINDNFQIFPFSKPNDALSFCRSHSVDIALVDADMPDINGIELSAELHKINPSISIIITTAYKEYAFDAYQQNCVGYLLKPIRRNELEEKINFVIPYPDMPDNRITVKCFGEFSVFFDGKPLEFKFNKTKELFAYLIDRRCALVDSQRIMAALWDDDLDHTNYYKSLRADLKSTLASLPFPVLVLSFGSIGLLRGAIKCDYFDFMEGKGGRFGGEYMEQYSWAENTKGLLCEVLS